MKKAGLNAQTFFKTKLCPFLAGGSCPKGPKCSYAHDDDEKRELPNLKKTKMCQLFSMGKIIN